MSLSLSGTLFGLTYMALSVRSLSDLDKPISVKNLNPEALLASFTVAFISDAIQSYTGKYIGNKSSFTGIVNTISSVYKGGEYVFTSVNDYVVTPALEIAASGAESASDALYSFAQEINSNVNYAIEAFEMVEAPELNIETAVFATYIPPII